MVERIEGPAWEERGADRGPRARPAIAGALAVAVALTLSATGAVARPAAAEELTIQARWRLLPIAVGADPDLALGPLCKATESAIERELPGLDLEFDLDALRRFDGPPPGVELANEEVVRFGLRAAEAAGVAVADYDVVFVFSPLYRGQLFGFSHVDFDARDGRMARGGAVHTEPARLVREAIRERRAARAAPAEPGAPGALRRALARAADEAAEAAVERLLDLPGIREAILAPTIAHELGHFFAPGDLDVRDGYQAPWMPHATGPSPAQNPWGHGFDCCMFKEHGNLVFYARKLIAMRGRVVVFCDTCREKLGCVRPAEGER